MNPWDRFLERFSEWKKLVKDFPPRKLGESLFEFYKVNCDWITDTNPPGGMTVERCQPLPYKRATQNTLSGVCASEFGAGAFVALEVGEGLDGLPLSYWLIKVKASDQHSFKRVFLEEQRLRPYRQFRPLAPAEEEGFMKLAEGMPYWAAGLGEANIFFQRGAEAALAAHSLKEVPDPEIKKRKAKRKQQNTKPEHDYVRLRRKEGARKKEIVPEVMEKFGVDADRAENIYRNTERTRQIKAQKARKRKAHKQTQPKKTDD